MTEREWLQCGFPNFMLDCIRHRPNLGRKRRLFAVACCRHVWTWMPEKCRSAVDIAERLADTLVPEEERWEAYVTTGEVYDDFAAAWAAYCAHRAVELPCDYPDFWNDEAPYWLAQTAVEPAAWINGQWDMAVAVRERAVIADLIRDIFGNPFRPVSLETAWLTEEVLGVAAATYEERHLPAGTLDPTHLAELAAALQAAGCDDEVVLGHLRRPGPHVRGCHILDLLLGKA